MDIFTTLDMIERTHLLFEDDANLAAYLKLNTNYFAQRNKLSSKKRGKTNIEKNLESLSEHASEISKDIFPDKNSFRLQLVVDDYYKATQSGNFANPSNDRHKYHDGNRIIYNKIKGKSEILLNIIKDLVTNNIDERNSELYSALHIDINRPYTAYHNYYAAIGILLYLNVIPFCDDKTRYSPKNWHLKKDTEKAIKLAESAFNLPKDGYENLSLLLLRINYNFSETKEWCRYLLILYFTNIIDEFIIQTNKDIALSYIKELRIPKQKYWYNTSDNWKECIIERAPQDSYYDLYIYEYFIPTETRTPTKRRINLRFEGAAKERVELSYIDEFYNIITTGRDENTFLGTYKMNEDSILINNGKMSFKAMTTDQIKEFKERLNLIEQSGRKVPLENEDKARENLLPLAGLNGIFLYPRRLFLIGLDSGDNSQYSIEPNMTNGLNDDFDKIKAYGMVHLYKIEGELYLVKTINGEEISCKVTKESGLTKLR